MPRHQQVTTCRRSGGPITRGCTCENCNLAVCAVCGAYEGGLTTDCPGTTIDFGRQREVFETCLDYTDDRGWHQGAQMEHRSPRFTSTRVPPIPPHPDPRAILAPAVDWTRVDQSTAIQHKLALQAIAWALADQECDNLSAALTHATDDNRARAEDSFQQACRRVEECDEQLRQLAHMLVDTLAGAPSTGRMARLLYP